MKRWLAALLIGRLFNNPSKIYQLEEKLANSAPIRQLAKTLVALFQRSLWELKRIKSIEFKPEQMTKEIPRLDRDKELLKSYQKWVEEMKRSMEKKG